MVETRDVEEAQTEMEQYAETRNERLYAIRTLLDLEREEYLALLEAKTTRRLVVTEDELRKARDLHLACDVIDDMLDRGPGIPIDGEYVGNMEREIAATYALPDDVAPPQAPDAREK